MKLFTPVKNRINDIEWFCVFWLFCVVNKCEIDEIEAIALIMLQLEDVEVQEEEERRNCRILSNRFRALRKPILLQPEKAAKIVRAACALYNFLVSTSSRRLYAPPGFADNSEHVQGDWRQTGISPQMVGIQAGNEVRAFSNNAKEVRSEFEEYFMNEGEVPS